MSKIAKIYWKHQNIFEISIDSLSKYSNQTNLYVNFRCFDICYSNLYVIYYCIYRFWGFKVYNEFWNFKNYLNGLSEPELNLLNNTFFESR